MSRYSVGRWLVVAGALFGLVVVTACVVAAIAVQRTAEARLDLVDRLYPAEAAGLRLLTAVVNQQTGVRGYALTTDDQLLVPYDAGRRQEREALADLERLSHQPVRSETLPADLARVRARAREWRTLVADPLVAEIRRERRPVTIRRADQGVPRFDAVRDAVRTLNAGIADARTEGRAHLDDSVRGLVASIIVICVALALAALAVALALRRGISEPLARLGADVRRVARGDLHHPLRAGGPADVVQLAADVDSMRQRIASDLEATRTAGERLEHQARDLARSNAELEQFAYVASHDLQEPLRKVASFCQLLQRRYHGQIDERADEYIDYAVDGAKRMQSLISDLLAFSRVGKTELSPVTVDLGDALRDALDNLAPRLDATDATVEASVLPDVLGEHSLLVAVFQNLIGNAVKFHGDRPPVVRVDAERVGNAWVVTCSDEGIGIEPQYAERIFAIFGRLHTKEDYPGTGIGLALTRKIVEHHGGRIWLDTDVARGTTFRFTLPVAQEAGR